MGKYNTFNLFHFIISRIFFRLYLFPDLAIRNLPILINQ